MLVLTRRCQQAVVVGNCGDGGAQTLTVTVLDITRGRVKLGFDVAADVAVHRREVWAQINGNGGAGSPKGGSAAPK